MDYTKISIVTSNYNGGEYLEETIKSILNQNYPNLEYIIIDGGSTDNSIEIIKRYEKQLSYWVSEKDEGLYDALDKGFKKSTGEIMGWLNSDDMLHHNSLFTLNELFKLETFNWVQGFPTLFDEHARTVRVANLICWSKFDFWLGECQWIQQESTFWSRELWLKSGGYIDKKLKLAGDFELWNRFFKYENLHYTYALIGGFRIRSRNQLSLDNMDMYIKETRQVLANNVYSQETFNIMKKIKFIKKIIILLKKFYLLNNASAINYLNRYISKIADLPKPIHFNRHRQKFQI